MWSVFETCGSTGLDPAGTMKGWGGERHLKMDDRALTPDESGNETKQKEREKGGTLYTAEKKEKTHTGWEEDRREKGETILSCWGSITEIHFAGLRPQGGAGPRAEEAVGGRRRHRRGRGGIAPAPEPETFEGDPAVLPSGQGP